MKTVQHQGPHRTVAVGLRLRFEVISLPPLKVSNDQSWVRSSATKEVL